jgi:aminocarboxymuconate-semialdehyde decarboxylase
MSNRREFLRTTAQAAAGIVFTNCSLLDAAPQATAKPPKRRQVVVGGKRIRTIDVHAHCLVPEAMAVPGNTPSGSLSGAALQYQNALLMKAENAAVRLQKMDEQGIDMQVLSINPFWYAAGRDAAERLIRIQNEKLAEICAANSERFAGLATVALQFPDLAAEQLVEGVKKLGLRGVSIGGSVNGEELSARKFDAFWAKAEELGVLIFMHPQPQPDPLKRLQGNGLLNNVIGNPLETTIALSHLIFEGTLDRYPGLKLCSAHGGGFLASYADRSDHGCIVFPEQCEKRALKKRPTEYLRQLYFDSIVFSPEALRHLVAATAPYQIVMGTDYPYPWTTTSVDHILSTPGLTNSHRRAILGETASKLLGLPPQNI